MDSHDDVLAEFERRVYNEYRVYALSQVGWENEDGWHLLARDRGIVLRWNQKGVSIVDNNVVVKKFRNPYGS